jgi:hypothetical protein
VHMKSDDPNADDTASGQEYAPSAPAQVWMISGLPEGEKLTLLWWWSKADHHIQRTPKRCTVWAAAIVAEDGTRTPPGECLLADLRRLHPDRSDRTIRDYIRGLADRGLAFADGRCIDLVPPGEAVPDLDRLALRASVRSSAARRKSLACEVPPPECDNLPVNCEGPPPGCERLHNQSSPPDPPINSPQPPTDTGAPFVLTSPGEKPTPAKPDRVSDVVKYFDTRVSEARAASGLPPPKGTTITAEYRSLIAARMRETEGTELARLESCKRVIDVQIHQAMSEGTCEPTKADQTRLRKTIGWKCLRITTLFRNSSNFGRWLERWSEDGDHELWGQPRSTEHRYGDGSGKGSRVKLLAQGRENNRPELERADTIPDGCDSADDEYGQEMYR